MNILSLFDGMACGLQALKQAGIPVTNYFASEVDKYAIQIAKKNHPEIIHLGDVTKWQEWNLPKIDLLIGGSPCQGFSFAGKGLNFDDPRSALFFEFVKIKEALNPRFFMLENVKMKKEHQAIISQYLKAEPIEINSSLVSAQNRKRIYWANWKFGQPEDRMILLGDVVENGFVSKEKSYCVTSSIACGLDRRDMDQNCGKRQVVFLNQIDRNKKNNLNKFTRRDLRKLTPIECERLQTLPDNYTEGVSNTQRYKMLGNGWTVAVVEHIFRSMPLEKEKFKEFVDKLIEEVSIAYQIPENILRGEMKKPE